MRLIAKDEIAACDIEMDVRQAVGLLPAHLRKTTELLLAGLSFREAGKELDMTRQNVQLRFKQIKELLSRRLKDYK